jgi:protein-S-isoprenylcysteine O-methyltransferase Ste14
MDGIATLAGLCMISAYTWSIRGHFSSPATPPGAWVISAAVSVSMLLLIWLTWTVTQPIYATLGGLLVELSGALMFAAAIAASRKAKLRFAFDPAHPHGLVDSGPYRLVRHPFYVSYLLFWAGWAIATWSAVAVGPPLVFLVLYMLAARMEERNFASSPLAAEHNAYKKRVGFFIPRF